MKKLKFICFLLGLSFTGHTQNTVNRVVGYQPAPGQHINIEQIGTPQAAAQMPENVSNLVSLGNFGGNIILAFEKACVNDPQNPFGIDLTIFGNAFSGSSEPGVVWVMKDENKNGAPDDLWYEIAGSRYFHSKTVKNYEVTYFKTETRDVRWKDNQGNSGIRQANSYNTQEYYPAPENFPDYPQDSITFSGTLLYPEIDDSNPAEIKLASPAFGYADNRALNKERELTSPDNPYSEETEGAGGDPIDISWAVDNNGNYVELDSIHFIKIVTGYFTDLGRLGEASTDVAYVVDVVSNPSVSGKENLLVLYPHPAKILKGDSVSLETCYFSKGRKTESVVGYSSSNTQVAEVNANGKLRTKNAGESVIRISASGETQSTTIKVIIPDSITILSDFSAVYPGDTILLETKVYDNEGDEMESEVIFLNQNPEAGTVFTKGTEHYFAAQNPGSVSLQCSVPGFDAVQQILFNVLSEDDIIDIYFTLKTEDENLLPLQWMKVGLTGLNSFVENRQNDYSGLNRFYLAHALLSGLQKAEVGFKFRDDENSGNKFYLYSVENEGEFIYGWGGKTSPQAYARAWIARLNGKQVVNDFDKVEIASGDTICLYHQSDITVPWVYTRMLSDKDSAGAGDELKITLEQTTCTFSGGTIIESGFTPVQNREILAGQSYYSNSSGVAGFILSTEPPLEITSGNDAVLISKPIITTAGDLQSVKFQVYPNPVENQLKVSGENLSGAELIILNLNGQPVLRRIISSDVVLLNVQDLDPGIYILKMVRKAQVETFKFIKK